MGEAGRIVRQLTLGKGKGPQRKLVWVEGPGEREAAGREGKGTSDSNSIHALPISWGSQIDLREGEVEGERMEMGKGGGGQRREEEEGKEGTDRPGQGTRSVSALSSWSKEPELRPREQRSRERRHQEFRDKDLLAGQLQKQRHMANMDKDDAGHVEPREETRRTAALIATSKGPGARRKHPPQRDFVSNVNETQEGNGSLPPPSDGEGRDHPGKGEEPAGPGPMQTRPLKEQV